MIVAISILVSILTAGITSKIVATHYYRIIDDHLDKTVEIVKVALNERRHQ